MMKWWDKVIVWSINIVCVVFLIFWAEGGLRTWGIAGFILFNVFIAAWRMWQGREMLKDLLGYAHNLGKIHGGKVNDKSHKRRKDRVDNV